MSPSEALCALATCPLNHGSNECLEGHDDPATCPNYRVAPTTEVLEAVAEAQIPAPPADPEPLVPMWSGRPLSAGQADSVTAARGARVVLIAGVAESGKTTLMASLFDRFQRGAFDGWRFGGSRTLMGFEERCFDSRLASGRTAFATLRTTADHGAQLFHMDLAEVAGTRRETLLLPDLPAERFETVINDVSAWGGIPIVERIDRMAVLLDGDRLLDPETRWVATAQSGTLLRGALEKQVVDCAAVDLVVTKWDRLVAASAEELAAEAVATLIETAQRVCGESALVVLHTAARSSDESVEPGFGLDDLLTRWLSPSTPSPPREVTVDLGNRAFAKFQAPGDSL